MLHSKVKEVSLPTKKQIETERKRYRRQKAYNKALRGTVYVLTIVAAVAVLIATLVLPVLQIEGTSMEPTLSKSDVVLLAKTTQFDHGDLCGFTWNNKLLVKRVIGTPGDWIEIDAGGNVYRNGDKLDEPYVQVYAMGECDLEFPFQVPQEQYFVMGDMRESSIDSRNTLIGCIPKDQIVGKVFLRVWPLKDIQLF
ncbi:MAG: signal peptidase I [Clostridia bacterium]|nr:signal peptidase I [Clostridia bacterium]